ncbi:US12 family protein [Verrucomicrobiaceae bacterium R5-34]|uniref:US12 family protein n=1 Tax=Oceaniferula flava TaxID=2800421 RepID=A0AAE2SCY2_9BACT|nr:Bax inhibitor-1 family protein [Oceaniferula flavus]MBK1830056.1 US12 family protein [Verrucomicrobiaceae bacterium R5-34]MBK1855097.1 US12 family protein [Oceaniferula flavus]MBM1136403.1 US12 family protein [Oceaniferula flavus]
MENPYSSPYANPYTVAAQPVDVRAAFIRKTYGHLAGAILVFALIEAALMSIPGIEITVFNLLAKSPYSWLMVLGGFMAVSWIADKWANSDTSKGMQYLGLSVYVAAEALIFLPLLLMAKWQVGDTSLIMKAGGVTMLLFLGLSVIAFTTKKDFSFLGGMLKIVGLIAIGLIVLSIVFPGFITLGLWFSVAMVILAAGSILYSTSNIIHHYNTNQYVAASLGLFASVALMFYYILRIFMSRD